MLEIRGLTKTFASPEGPRRALDSVDLSAAGGTFLCLLGPNGAGKTTLFKALCGALIPDQGDILIAGERHPEARRLVGFSPGGERSFYGRLTGLENLRFFAALWGADGPALRRTVELLEAPLGLRELLPIEYQKMSAGMKQRLSLARALLHEPPLLLLDECTKSLDPLAAERLRSYLRQDYLRGARRVAIWSTHSVEEAWASGAEIAVFSAGRLAARGRPEQLERQAGTRGPLETYRALIGAAA